MVKNIILVVLSLLAVAAVTVAVIKHNKMKKALEANGKMAEGFRTVDPPEEEEEEDEPVGG